MKITIKAEPKEIADLVVALQSRRIAGAVLKSASETVSGEDIRKHIAQSISMALGSASCDTSPKD